MKTLKKISLILAVVAFLITGSCKKYPDGPLLSLYTKKHRMCGTWEVSYFSINGYDSTTYLKVQPCYGYYIFKIDKGDYRYTYNSFGNTGTDTSKYYSSTGSWEFTDWKNSIHITSHTDENKHFNIGAFAADDVTWEIRRLKEKELWLKTTYIDGREYFVKFNLMHN